MEASEDPDPGYSAEEFTCSCCFELLVEPTTVTCGHTFCRHCLAMWFLSSNTMLCPECRQTWTGIPRVNDVLRSTINKLYPGSIAARELAVADDRTTRENVMEFEARLYQLALVPRMTPPPAAQAAAERAAAARAAQAAADPAGFLANVFGLFTIHWYHVAIAVGMMLSISLLNRTDYNLLIHKPVIKWTTDDVIHWMSGLGAWTLEYKDQMKHQTLDGSLLMVINEDNVDDVFKSSNQTHRSSLLSAISIIKRLGVMARTTLWEYKELHPRKTLFFTLAISHPRLVILYQYLFDFEESFVPFIHTISSLDEAEAVNFTTLPPPTTGQWVEFIPQYLFFPYVMLCRFAAGWHDIHGIITRIVQISFLLMTIREANKVRFMISAERNHRKVLPVLLKFSVKNALRLLLFKIYHIFSFIIPAFVCDIIFYCVLFSKSLRVIEVFLLPLLSKYIQKLILYIGRQAQDPI